MIDLILGSGIAALLMALEYLLCTRLRSPLWGGLVPGALLAATLWLFTLGGLPLERRYLFPFVVVNVLFWGSWASGREAYRKRRQAELERMKAKDM